MRDAEAVAGMLCPVCKIGLTMSDRQGVEIDFCPQCRGVWLDRGELDKIIERSGAGEFGGAAPGARSASAVETIRQPQGGHYGDSEGRYAQGDGQFGQRRKRSFLSDLFD
ncbi:MAG: zf-TFIIB domain-containing protein [Sphingomonadaceae bacterium]|nr:zf-TFIIB domain-containing protein [Sphingomonadaceae bacterium]